jgi:hypothetical protein
MTYIDLFHHLLGEAARMADHDRIEVSFPGSRYANTLRPAVAIADCTDFLIFLLCFQGLDEL